jgi:hypothetical protein
MSAAAITLNTGETIQKSGITKPIKTESTRLAASDTENDGMACLAVEPRMA